MFRNIERGPHGPEEPTKRDIEGAEEGRLEEPVTEIEPQVETAETKETEKFYTDFISKEEEMFRAVSKETKPEKRSSFGKLKKALMATTLLTAMGVMGIIGGGPAYAAEYREGPPKETKKTEMVEEAPEEVEGLSAEEQKEFSLKLLADLIIISTKETEEKSPAKDWLNRKRAAEMYINVFCARIKTGETGPSVEAKIGPEDVRKSLEILKEYISVFADQEYGDKDDKTSDEEFEKFEEKTKGLAGFEKLEEMIETYLPEEEEESKNSEQSETKS